MRNELKQALAAAQKEKQEVRVATLRLILAAIKDRDIAARTSDSPEGVSDDEILQILAKMIKQRRESAATYEEAGRLDLAERERQEIEIIEEFLPRQLNADEIRMACSQVIDEVGAEGLKDMGKCMGALKERFNGAMDFGRAGKLMKDSLS